MRRARWRGVRSEGKPVDQCSRVLIGAHFGRFVSDSELNLVVAKLLEYLRSSSLLVSACAFNEVSDRT